MSRIRNCMGRTKRLLGIQSPSLRKRSNLNSRTEKTKKVMHLMVTSLCDRDCKYCCNKQYDLNSIPYATDEELREVRYHVYGREPFAYTKPNAMAYHYKHKYPNIMRVIVYTNACEVMVVVDYESYTFR